MVLDACLNQGEVFTLSDEFTVTESEQSGVLFGVSYFFTLPIVPQKHHLHPQHSTHLGSSSACAGRPNSCCQQGIDEQSPS